MNRYRIRHCGKFRGAVLLLLFAAPLLAQSTTSSLKGLVLGSEGEPVAGAVVEAYAASLGIARTATSDKDGLFQFDLLQPGTWLVVARHGPASSDSKILELRLQQTGETTLRLGAGSVDELNVSGARPTLDAARTSQELRVRRSQSEELPLLGRDATDLARLDSAVRAPSAGNFYGERAAVFVVNGQTGRSNSYLVDGLDNNDQTSGTSLNAFFSQQVIKEFVVLTSQYAPEFGRASGGILNIITERGSNEFEGGVFVQGIPSSWNTASDFLAPLPSRGQSQDAAGGFSTGFHVGGPIKQDKFFLHNKLHHVLYYINPLEFPRFLDCRP